MNVRRYNVIILHLLHVLFIFTWLCAVNVPKFIVDNKKKGSLSEHENRNFKIRLDCFGQSNFASLYSNFHICNLLSLYRPCFLSETKKRFLYTQWIHIFMLEELKTHG